jgi:xeroderma pigmentosum group C-complementing protein
LDSLNDGEEDSSLSEVTSEEEFEDALSTPAVKNTKIHVTKENAAEGEDESDDEMEWEDAVPSALVHTHKHHEEIPSSEQAGLRDLELTIENHEPFSLSRSAAQAAVGKKGPSKIERTIRVLTHCMHVQFLILHNAVRNNWVNDKEVQKILVDGLSEGIMNEVKKWRRSMGLLANHDPDQGTDSAETKGSGKGKSKEKSAREKIRDWGADASKLENATPNLSRGDPLLRLLKYLMAYWRKRFRITAPSLRKVGYRPVHEVDAEIKSFQNETHDPSRHGERVESVAKFRELAKRCEGSRDVGAQLFTALLRGLGIETRMVASLQPIGFGWTKHEEAESRKEQGKVGNKSNVVADDNAIPPPFDSEEIQPVKRRKANEPSLSPVRGTTTKTRPSTAASRRPKRGTTSAPISLHNTSSELSDPPADADSFSDSDLSIMEITPSTRTASKLGKPHDIDLTFPTYWTEVLSPVSNIYIPISVFVNPIIATQPEHLTVFEPRGAAAEKSKQVLCYVVAYSADRSAKDVTVRYLKKHIWPGKTKGFRIQPEKVVVYNKSGKVLRHEEYDWFKRVVGAFERPVQLRTAADDIEEQKELVSVQPERKTKDGKNGGEETLQGYKASDEFVLQRFLKREEALLPSAQPVKYFTTGKGVKEKKEAVYRRVDVVPCKTVETWHREGRQVKAGEHPMKHVPYRAMTLIRRREIEDATRLTGEIPLQGLYAENQTEWIVPDPIGPDGKIPKNEFGNMDVYVPSMVPKGAVHIPLRGTAKVCKILGIEFAEACTGFEFGKQRAVPVLTGVVVAKENEDTVIDAWEEEMERQRLKEVVKQEKLVLGLWRKFVTGLRIRERVRREYHNGEEEEQQELGQSVGGNGQDVA